MFAINGPLEKHEGKPLEGFRKWDIVFCREPDEIPGRTRRCE